VTLKDEFFTDEGTARFAPLLVTMVMELSGERESRVPVVPLTVAEAFVNETELKFD
jgi:hypothetical protein